MKKFLQIFSVLLLSCISVVAIGMAKPQTVRAADKCAWINSAQINCGTGEWRLDVTAISDVNKEQFAFFNEDRSQVLIVNDTSSATWGSGCNPYPSCQYGSRELIDDEKKTLTSGDYCTQTSKEGDVCTNGFSGQITITKEIAASLSGTKAASDAASAADKPCTTSPLGFFLCPLSDMFTGILNWALDIFTQLLELPPLQSSNVGLVGAVNSIRNIANAFYVIIFLIIIFANFIAIPGLDNYSVKKLLPKLITVIILTQFSYLICSVMVDIGNIAGQTIPSAIATTFNAGQVSADGGVNGWIAKELLNPLNFVIETINSPTPATAGAATAGVALTGVGLFMFGFIIVIVAVVIVIISLFYLMMRWFGIMLLTIFAPIAFAAWVLPNTEKFAKMWITAFVKLTLMYVLVMSMLVSATIIKSILQNSSTEGGSALGPFVAIFIPLIAIALVPKCLKVSSSMLTAAGKMVADSKAGKVGAAAAKKSGQEGKLAELKGKGFGALSKTTPGKAGKGFATQQAAAEARVKDAKSKLYDSMSTEKLIALSKKGDDAAAGALKGKYQKKRIEAKQAYDAGIEYAPNSKEANDYNELATAAGGDDYVTSVSKFRTNSGGGTATQQPAGGGGNAPNPVTAPQPPPGGGGGGGGSGGGGTNPNVAANMRNANRRGQGANNWRGGPGTPPNPTPPSNPPLGPPPPPPGGSSTP